jgi:hypothetical protein
VNEIVFGCDLNRFECLDSEEHLRVRVMTDSLNNHSGKAQTDRGLPPKRFTCGKVLHKDFTYLPNESQVRKRKKK